MVMLLVGPRWAAVCISGSKLPEPFMPLQAGEPRKGGHREEALTLEDGKQSDREGSVDEVLVEEYYSLKKCTRQ